VENVSVILIAEIYGRTMESMLEGLTVMKSMGQTVDILVS
jgi:hypothetical protein